MISASPRIILSLLLLVSILMSAACKLSHPTDQELEQTLRANQSDFDRLVAMLAEDKDIVRLDDKFVFFTEKVNREVPEERLRAYRDLFAKLKLERGFYRDKDNALRFIASARDVVASSEKSYIYSTTPPVPLVGSLDQVIERDQGDQKPVYKKLHGDWYLYYASW